MNLLLSIILLVCISCAHTERMLPLIKFKSYDLINVGEFHGTKETPKYFFSLVSKYAQKNSNAKIALGLEIPKSEERYVKDFIRTGDESYLKKSYFFTQEYQDGRASIDMVRGLKLISNYKNITVFCFDQNKPLNNNRDKVMAQNIVSILKTKSFDKVFTYSGHLHATKEIGTPWEPKRKSMGFFLEKEGVKAMSIRVEFLQGESWICNGMTPDTCGIKKVGSTSFKLSKVGILKVLEIPKRGYDAFFLLKNVTPSKPWNSSFH